MFKRHRYKEAVKAYLLGELDETRAASLEKMYFSDPAFFDWVWEMEDELIGLYLSGRLSNADREHFESRYLRIPALNKRLEQVRARLLAGTPKTFRIRWELICTAALLVCSAAAYWFWPQSHAPASANPPQISQNRQPAQPTPVLALLSVRLSPGLMKGPGSKQAEFAPPPDGRVSLTLELPGVRTRLQCQVFLTVVGPSGRRETTWFSDPLETRPASGGQEVRTEIKSERLPAADYIAEVRSSSNEVLETYSFRVTSSH